MAREYTLLVDYESYEGWSEKHAVMIPNDELSDEEAASLKRLDGHGNPNNYPDNEDSRKDRDVWDRLYSKYTDDTTRLPVLPPGTCITRVYQMYK